MDVYICEQCRGMKKAFYILELELWRVVSHPIWMLGTGPDPLQEPQELKH